MKSDMLVKLYDMPEATGVQSLLENGVAIKRALAPDRAEVLNFVTKTFGAVWEGECAAAFSRTPATCYLAVKNKRVVGFACFDVTALDFFGPTGVAPESRGQGIGRVLLLKCLHSMQEMGYAYAVIGDVGDAAEFYRKSVSAVRIPDSYPGIYSNMISK